MGVGLFSALQFILMISGGVVSALKQNGAAAELIALAEAGLEAFQKVHDTAVTKDELQSLRITPQW